MRKLTAELCRTFISAMNASQNAGKLSITSGFNLQAMEIALPVLEQHESEGDVFIIMRKPGKVPDIKRPVGDITDYLLQLYQHNPEAVCDVVTYRFAGLSGQWVQDGRELLAMLEVTQTTTTQIENDGWIEWGGVGRPVDHMDFVEVKFRNQKKGSGMAHWWVWNHAGEDDDIIAYRVLENDGREG